ncbi:DUF5799 family protein [Salinigranum halophilum]|mgnify:FL=1|jgi:hypothetical protein|uniref:DUF5799 family protein n=1 Tax=Salinigranum halophilum TaxID=2565931 RepID=UPI0010A7D141|nr:DUF5799 family protein [Salinigranum halophilum]
MADWTDRIVGDRMTVDREFNDRVMASEFASQEWSLIMTATEFEIENADDPERARIVANTDKLEGMMPHIEEAGKRQQSMAGGGGRDDGGGDSIIDTVKGALGLGNGREDHDAKLAAAEKLVQEYADELQSHLESRGKWEQVRRSYDS